MPHRCMDCKNIVDSGSIDLKMGCPVCGCKKFQYVRPKKEPKPSLSPTVAEYVARAEKVAREELEASMATREAMEQTREAAVKPENKEEKPAEISVPQPEPRSEGPRIESVRIIEPGTYDINLPVLMNRKELVMSKEEGSYFVDLPSALKPAKKGWRQKK